MMKLKFKDAFSMFILILAFGNILECYTTSYQADYNKYLRFHWQGALTSHSIILKIFPYPEASSKDNYNSILVIYTQDHDNLPTDINQHHITFSKSDYPVGEITIESLTPLTQYFYTFIFTSEDTIADASFINFLENNTPQTFSFKTPNMVFEPYSFRFAAASCARTGSASPVFESIVAENPLFFVHMGDMHYSDITINDVELYYEAYYNVFASPTQKTLYQSIPIFYNWDDHDFGPNDSKGDSVSKPAATTVYKNFVPYGTLKNYLPADDYTVFPDNASKANISRADYISYTSDPTYGIFRSYIVGRCLFIQLDLRSFKDLESADILGDEQRKWFENQLKFAGDNTGIKMIFIISSVPWIDQDSGAVWEDYKTSQQEIGGLIKNYIYNNNKQIMMIAGDAHMTAFDDGTNNNYGGFPVIQAASLDQTPSCKGGPYSHGTNPDVGQYAIIQIRDDPNGSICIQVDLKQFGDAIISYNTCYPEMYPPAENIHCSSKASILVGYYKIPIIICLLILLFATITAVYFKRWSGSTKTQQNDKNTNIESLLEITETKRDVIETISYKN